MIIYHFWLGLCVVSLKIKFFDTIVDKNRIKPQTNSIYHGQPDFLTQGTNLNFNNYCGPQFLNLLILFMKFRQSRKYFGPFFSLFVHFSWFLREKQDNYKDFNINLIFAMFLSNDKKVQGPQKQVGGPQFGHAWFIPRFRRSQSLSHIVGQPAVVSNTRPA